MAMRLIGVGQARPLSCPRPHPCAIASVQAAARACIRRSPRKDQTSMPALALLLHIAAALALLAAVVVRMLRPAAISPRVIHLAAIAFTAATVLGMQVGGWWPEMGRIVRHIFATSIAGWLIVTLLGLRVLGTAAAWFHAGAFLAIGLATLRHGTPLPALLACKSVALGLALALLSALASATPKKGARIAGALLFVVIAAAGLAPKAWPLVAPSPVRPAWAP